MEREELKKVLEKIKVLTITGSYRDKEELIEFCNKSIKIDYTEGIIMSKSCLAWISFMEQNLQKAIDTYKDAIKLAAPLEVPKLKASIYNNLAMVYIENGERKKGIAMYYKALDEFTKLDEKEYIARVFVNLSHLYINKDDEKVEELLVKASQYGTSEYVKERIGINLATLYQGQKKYDKALVLLDEQIENNPSNKELFIHLYEVRGTIYLDLKKFDAALKDFDAALDLIDENTKKARIASAKSVRLKILYKLKNYEELKKEAFHLLTEYQTDIVAKYNIYNLLYKTFKKEKKYKKALRYHKRFIKQKDKFEAKESKKMLNSLEAKYQSRLKEQEKEVLRLQKMEMEQKALRVQLNPHFFFNSLNSINNFILNNDANNASKFLSKFSSLMRKTLENSEESFITIEDELDYLTDYLTLEQLRFNFSFNYEITIDEAIEEDFIKIPTMMLQPYVENCIKHGINGLENGSIKIKFKALAEDKVLCTIEDNGKGLQASSSQHKSMGTSILENRLQILKEHYQLDYTVNITDLSSENRTGTRVSLLFTI